MSYGYVAQVGDLLDLDLGLARDAMDIHESFTLLHILGIAHRSRDVVDVPTRPRDQGSD